MMNVRAVAAQVIESLLRDDGSLSSLLPQALSQVSGRDQGLLRELCYGTARNAPKLDCIAQSLLQRPLRSRDQDVFALILIGLYQLLATRVPSHAAIGETVEAAHQLEQHNKTGLINAILRRFDRDRDLILKDLKEELTFKYNHPEWFIFKLKSNWPDHWEDILSQNNEQAPMTLRVNIANVSRETYLQKLDKVGIKAKLTKNSDSGIQLLDPVDVAELPNFETGEVSVQDEAAQLSKSLLGATDGEYVLDACAAPGGKLCHILEGNNLNIDALEVSNKRIDRIRENLERIGLNANVIEGDATENDWWSGTKYDKILLDAPCSATGVIRRNPDIKILRKGEAIHELSKLQRKILDNLWEKLKPGGRLVYATCSIFPQENEKLVAKFINETQGVRHSKIVADWGMEREYGRQLFPEKEGHDGFYYAVLEKIEI